MLAFSHRTLKFRVCGTAGQPHQWHLEWFSNVSSVLIASDATTDACIVPSLRPRGLHRVYYANRFDWHVELIPPFYSEQSWPNLLYL